MRYLQQRWRALTMSLFLSLSLFLSHLSSLFCSAGQWRLEPVEQLRSDDVHADALLYQPRAIGRRCCMQRTDRANLPHCVRVYVVGAQLHRSGHTRRHWNRRFFHRRGDELRFQQNSFVLFHGSPRLCGASAFRSGSSLEMER